MTTSDGDELPLDPDLARVERKLRRLVAVSGLIMVAGLIAVFAAIFYRLSGGGRTETSTAVATGEAGDPIEIELAVPAGATVTHTSLAADALVVTLGLADGRTAIWIVGAGDGRVRQRILVTPARPD